MEWTPKKSAILGLVFSGTSMVFLSALIMAMNWQHGRSPGQKDWGIVFAAVFGVPFVCCSAAAVLSFIVSVSLIAYKRFLGFQQASPIALTTVLKTHTERYDTRLSSRWLVSRCWSCLRGSALSHCSSSAFL